MTISSRTKNAVKPALAMVIAYGVSLGMGWKNPYWAGFAVAMISLSTAGQSLNKGVLRMLGTLVAATAALTFIAWFAQDRWWFISVLSVYIGFCTYMVAGSKRQYFWYCCAFVCLIICDHAAGNLANAFDIALLRAQQTGMGILVYSLVSVFLWPTDSRGMLEATTRKLFTSQAAIYRNYRDLMNGHGTVEESRPLRIQEVQLLTQRAQLLNAAETDSYEVWEMRYQWRHLHRLSADLLEVLEQWRQSFNEIQQLNWKKLLPNTEDFLSEVDDRFVEIEHMLTGDAPSRTPKPINLVVETKGAQTHFQTAAVAVTQSKFERLDMLSRAVYDCVREIKGFGLQSLSPVSQDVRGSGFGLDPDRLHIAAKTTATFWAAFLIWFYIDPPGHETLVGIATIVALGATLARLSPVTLFAPLIFLTLLAGILYIFVMPHLSGFTQLGAMIFLATFGIYYLFWQPRQGLVKSIGAAMFLAVIGVQNQQTYNFAGFANTVVMIALACGIAIAIWYIPPSPRPEKEFLRLLARFYRESEYLIAHLALDWEQRSGWAKRWKTLLYQNDLLELPQKLSVRAGQIDYHLIPGTTPEQVQTLVNSLQSLALRLKHMADVRTYPQAALMLRELLEDVRAWRMALEELFRNWSGDPAAKPVGNLQGRLLLKVEEMETRISRTLSLAEEGELHEKDYENFYRLIGSYRALSESVVEHAELIGAIDWGEWEEERF